MGVDSVSLICIFLFLPSTRLFGSSLASGSIETPKLSEFRQGIPRMGDLLGSARVNSQKQNREGVVRAQSRQYRATTESSPGCGGGQGRDVTPAARSH